MRPERREGWLTHLGMYCPLGKMQRHFQSDVDGVVLHSTHRMPSHSSATLQHVGQISLTKRMSEISEPSALTSPLSLPGRICSRHGFLCL